MGYWRRMVNLEFFVALIVRGRWSVVRVVKQGSIWLHAPNWSARIGVELIWMGLEGCLDVFVRIQIACHPVGTMVIHKKTGVKARFGTLEFIPTINTLGALSLVSTCSKALCASFGIPVAIGITNIGGDSWISTSTSHHDKKLTTCPT